MEKFFCPASMGNVGLVDDNVVFTQCAIEYSMVWARGGGIITGLTSVVPGIHHRELTRHGIYQFIDG